MTEFNFVNPKNITVGDELPVLTKHVTQEMINRWAEVSGDFNPLHVDPEFGRKTQFGTNIAHGPLSLSFLIEMLTRWLGKPWLVGGRLYDLKLISPVPPDTKLTIGGRVLSTDADKRQVECEVFVKNEDEKLVITGKASCRF
ncbi:MAG: acyl dehydratase [Deltaproteobacteria bacterium]|nr:MAG: acyl dehydratase [Deltaproteobacteria bacterium]